MDLPPDEVSNHILSFIPDSVEIISHVCSNWSNIAGLSGEIYTVSMPIIAQNLEILKCAIENGCPWNEWICAYAAEAGHLEILKWARENGCPWDKWTCAYAAGGGHLEILKWARENKCPWDEWTCACAAEGGHLEVLQWARKNGCPWDKNTCSKATYNGHYKILEWLYDNECACSRQEECDGSSNKFCTDVQDWDEDTY